MIAWVMPSIAAAQQPVVGVPFVPMSFVQPWSLDSSRAPSVPLARSSDGQANHETETAGGLASLLATTGQTVYRIARGESDDVPAAIERSIAHMNFIIRPIARHRLARTNRVPGSVTFTVRSDTLVVTFERSNPIVTPLDGSFVPWVSGVSEEVYRVRAMPVADTLHQLISASDGWRADDFVFVDGGRRLELHVTLSANLLPKPVRYGLVFERTEELDRTPRPVDTLAPSRR